VQPLEELHTVLYAMPRFLTEFANILQKLPLLGSIIARL
jgi:hypothetical protein